MKLIKNKVVIVGARMVGSATLYSLLTLGMAQLYKSANHLKSVLKQLGLSNE
ncbi:MAG: hypothetical protein PWP27_1648 [Clostridiales bacterium]|jgi:malate/lactate dehydrogenase|nr:hypothetical protein [Clostridiales bacterium]MDK2933838.1 hypothetical protein [Clostridiales bacterium]